MSTQTHNACLFGGALFAAVITSAASAGFIVGDTTHNAGFVPGPIASGYAGGGSYDIVSSIGAGSGPSSASVSFPTGTTVDVVLSANEMSGEVTKIVPSFGYFEFFTEFMVDADVDVTVSWDADSGIGSPTDRTLRIFEGINTTVFEYDATNGPHSGSMTVSLFAGLSYTVDATYRSTFANGGGFFSVVIPAPGVIAVLPFTGLYVSRRRR